MKQNALRFCHAQNGFDTAVATLSAAFGFF